MLSAPVRFKLYEIHTVRRLLKPEGAALINKHFALSAVLRAEGLRSGQLVKALLKGKKTSKYFFKTDSL